MFTLVRQWRESGLTRQEFCLQHGITLGKFSYWISLEGGSIAVDSGFIPMSSPGITGHSVLSVIYPNGVRLEVPMADSGLLSRLISLV